MIMNKVYLIVDCCSGAFTMDAPSIKLASLSEDAAWEKFSKDLTYYCKDECKKRASIKGFFYNPEDDTDYETWEKLLDVLREKFRESGSILIDSNEWDGDSDPYYYQIIAKELK